MTQNRKWLLLPPAIALLIVLGPLSMRGETEAAERIAATRAEPAQGPAPAPATTPASRTERLTATLPRTPDLWQVGSTLIGVLLLGGVGVMVLRRLRQPPATSHTGTVTLRQSLRLPGKQIVHAIEFDGRILLVGEGERGLQLLHATTPPSAAEDEAAVAAAIRERIDADDDGAVPRDLVLPRPPVRAKLPAAAPAPAAIPAPAARAQGPAARPAAKVGLGDFRALLAKVGR